MRDLFYRTKFRPKNSYWYILTKRYAMKVVEGSLEASVNVLLFEMKKKRFYYVRDLGPKKPYLGIQA